MGEKRKPEVSSVKEHESTHSASRALLPSSSIGKAAMTFSLVTSLSIASASSILAGALPPLAFALRRFTQNSGGLVGISGYAESPHSTASPLLPKGTLHRSLNWPSLPWRAMM
eukprot:CAMPEP_0206237890 /NCGR_PEP_ID=MMETSP0047_2-20121206/14515_1 /ASSEMBLY_ACC=CAM_ASM_000192 /TAXON_ID=195065 /ORGANISM="Chroomonas mesostigmatica_cf, Strain CCMP1168" /LENGTH=112 /DNA_ID=CAMNT_0053662373 /DNA_START=216 /DNA_END=554 /DNA_ORIENTATION=+